jgi:polyferredoxin
MQSHCLNHQDTVATARCACCSKPLCDLCVQVYAEGKFCGVQCQQNAVASALRAAEMAQSDKELAEWKQRQLAYKLIGYTVVGFGLFFGWEYLPDVITSNVEKLWQAIKAFLKSIFP